MKSVDEISKVTWKSLLQVHLPQSSPVNSVKCFSKIDEVHLQWHILFNAFLLELFQGENHGCCNFSASKSTLCFE